MSTQYRITPTGTYKVSNHNPLIYIAAGTLAYGLITGKIKKRSVLKVALIPFYLFLCFWFITGFVGLFAPAGGWYYYHWALPEVQRFIASPACDKVCRSAIDADPFDSIMALNQAVGRK